MRWYELQTAGAHTLEARCQLTWLSKEKLIRWPWQMRRSVWQADIQSSILLGSRCLNHLNFKNLRCTPNWDILSTNLSGTFYQSMTLHTSISPFFSPSSPNYRDSRLCLVGAAPENPMELCHPVGSAVGRQCLRSASRGDLVVPRFRLQTFGHRAFSVSGPQIWNSLPQDQTIAWQFIAFQTETESAFISAVLSASVDSYLIKGLISFLYYYYYYYNYYYTTTTRPMLIFHAM